MQQTPKPHKKMTQAIVLGAMTITALCITLSSTPQKSSTIAKAGHFHAKMIYVGHAPRTANG